MSALCSVWTPIACVVVYLVAAAFTLSYLALPDASGAVSLRVSPTPTHSLAPSASPTFVVPVAVVYLSRRAVRGDFMLREDPERVCEEGAHALYGCARVAPLLSTLGVSLRRRAREMTDVEVVGYEAHGAIAHEVADLWTPGAVDLGAEAEFWSGAEPDGSEAAERCADFTSLSGRGVVGSRSISDGLAPCAEARRLLCICRTSVLRAEDHAPQLATP